MKGEIKVDKKEEKTEFDKDMTDDDVLRMIDCAMEDVENAAQSIRKAKIEMRRPRRPSDMFCAGLTMSPKKA